VSLLGQLRRRFDARQSGADDGDGRARRQLVDGAPQALGLLQFRDRIGDLARARHRRRHGARAANGVNRVVVLQRRPSGDLHAAVPGVDAGGRADHERDAVAEHAGVVDRGIVGAGDELVQPDPLDESRTRVDEGDVEVGPHPQMVGRHRPGVAAADDGHLRACAAICHDVQTAPAGWL
jgi:hypothetical protein